MLRARKCAQSSKKQPNNSKQRAMRRHMAHANAVGFRYPPIARPAPLLGHALELPSNSQGFRLAKRPYAPVAHHLKRAGAVLMPALRTRLVLCCLSRDAPVPAAVLAPRPYAHGAGVRMRGQTAAPFSWVFQGAMAPPDSWPFRDFPPASPIDHLWGLSP